MSIVAKQSNIFRPATDGGNMQNANLTKGRLRVANASVANASDDLSGSTYELAKLPSHAIIDPMTEFKVDGWGFAQVVIGTYTDTTALVNATKASATTQTPVDKFDANHGKELWEVLGMATDPGGYITLFAHAVANATGAGTMPFVLGWYEN